MIWAHLDPSLCWDVPEPTQETTLNKFLQTLERREHLWQDLAGKYNE
jgi:hypothetical protein